MIRYLAWRGIPRDLGTRVRRYYEHYYTQRAIFDETSIIGDLNPQLQAELVTYMLSRTLSKLSILSRVNPDFRFALFYLLKPVRAHGPLPAPAEPSCPRETQ